MVDTAWVLVAGTGTTDPLDPRLDDTARTLGRALAEAGYSLVTCGWPGVDRAVGEAFVEALPPGQDPAERLVQYRRRGRSASVAAGGTIEVELEFREYYFAVHKADVGVVLGGTAGTRAMFDLALQMETPMLCLPRTEGVAREVFEGLQQSLDRDLYLGIKPDELAPLDAPPESAVPAAVELLRQHLAERTIHDGAYLDPSRVVGRDNNAAFDRLVVEMEHSGVMAFVGAGLSIPGGYPDWITLLERLREAVPEQTSRAMAHLSREEDLLMRAEHYHQLLGKDAFGRFIREQFGDDRGTVRPLHQDLVRLPFTHVLTTNYDTLLERAHVNENGELPLTTSWTNPGDIDDFLRAARRRQDRRRYVHLHGIYSDASSIVLTETDYQTRYHHTSAGETLLSVLFTAHPFLFVGFSFRDMDMMGVFRNVMARLSVTAPLHFAFVALDPRRHDPGLVRTRLRTKFKIEPIFYLQTPDHAGLHALVERLAKRLESGSGAPVAS